MMRYQPVIVYDDVYYPLGTIAEAFCLDKRFLRNLVKRTDECHECVSSEDEILVPLSVFTRLGLPFDKPMLHFLYGYARTGYLIRQIRRDTEFDYEEDDYFE